MEMTAITHPSTPMSIQSLITPNPGLGFSSQLTQTWNSDMGIGPGSLTQDLMDSLNHCDDVSSEGSTYSPASEGLQHQVQPQIYLPHYYQTHARSTLPLEDFSAHSYAAASSSASSYSEWNDFDVPQPFDDLDIRLERQFPASVGNPPFVCTAQEPSVDTLTDAPPPNAQPYMDRDGRASLRDEFTSAASMASGQGRMVNLDHETLQHYYECYITGFHSLFPILHYPTLISKSPPPLLNAMILAVGAQFSTRPISKWHSISIFEAASKLLANLLFMVRVLGSSSTSNTYRDARSIQSRVRPV